MGPGVHVFIFKFILSLFQVDAWLKEVGTRDAISWSRSGHETSDNLLLYGEC